MGVNTVFYSCMADGLDLYHYIIFCKKILALPHLLPERVPVLDIRDHNLFIVFQSESLMKPFWFVFCDPKFCCAGFRTEQIEREKIMKLKLPLLLTLFLFTPAISFADQPSEPGIEEKNIAVRLEVIKAKLSRRGEILHIRFRIHRGIGNRNSPTRYPVDAYAIEESTGEKFSVQRFVRAGALGQKRLEEGPVSLVIISNTKGKINKGSRITFVIGGLRQEHIVVEE